MKAVPPNGPHVCAEGFPDLLAVTILQPWRNLGWQRLSVSNIQAIYKTCQNISTCASVWLLGWGLLWAASPSLPFPIAPCHSQGHHRCTGCQPGWEQMVFWAGWAGCEHTRLGMVLKGTLGTRDSSWAVESRAPVPLTAEPMLPSAGGCCCIQISLCLLQCLGPEPCSDLSRLHITSTYTAIQLPVPFLSTL